MLEMDGGKEQIHVAKKEYFLLHVNKKRSSYQDPTVRSYYLSIFFLDVEEINTPARPAVSPAVVATAPVTESDAYYGNVPADDPWSQPAPVVPPSFASQASQQSVASVQSAHTQQHRYDYTNEDNYDYDSDFDDDDASRYGQPASGSAGAPPTHYRSNLPSTPDDAQSMTSNVPLSRKTSKIFSKSSDSYVMGTAAISVPENEQVNIYMNDQNLYFWKPIENRYTVTVTSPKMESKFKGIKKFIAYQLTSSFNNDPVSRRYKNFDWLHERLVDKFCLIPIPPLPDKQISGRYEEHFIEHRRAQLQQFVDWVCRHPVLSTCDVWMHFLTCKDQKRWKAGKRTAEKDAVRKLLVFELLHLLI